MNNQLRGEIFEHIKENALKKEIYLDTINGAAEHVHTLFSLRSDQTIATIAQLMKGESSHWVNDQRLSRGKFEWQDEYIAVSVSESMVEKVREYIRNQDEHHRTKTFTEEYEEFLVKFRFLDPIQAG